MLIRPEGPADEPAIDLVIESAFAALSHAHHTEAAIVRALRADGDLSLSLVAEGGAAVVGHIAFSPIQLDSQNGRWHGLGPLAVRPDLQAQGIGSSLVSRGLAELCLQGAAGCVVLGDPGFYSRFGFVSDGTLRYGDLPVRLIQRLVFDGTAPSGEVHYAPAFDLAVA